MYLKKYLFFTIALCGCSSMKLTEQELNSFKYEQHFQVPDTLTNTPCLTIDSYSVENGEIVINCSNRSKDSIKITEYLAFEYASSGKRYGGTVRIVNTSLSKNVFIYPYDIDLLGLNDYIYLPSGQTYSYTIHRSYAYPYDIFEKKYHYALVYYLGRDFCQDSLVVNIK